MYLTIEKRIRQNPESTTDQNSCCQSQSSATPAARETAETESSAGSTLLENELKPLPLFSGILSHAGDVVVEYEKGRTAIGMTAAVVKRTFEVRKCYPPPCYTAD